jgi:arylformamidase
MNGNWIDISVPLHSGMVHWPTDQEVRIERKLSLDRGDAMNLTAASMSVHTGTHMDAPLHFIAGAAAIDRMPLDATVGSARVLEFPSSASIGPAELSPFAIDTGERILLKTSNSRRCWQTDRFVADFVSVTPDGARHLAERGIRAVGIDYISIGADGEEGDETHRLLMAAGIWIIEGLDLSAVEPGDYDLICLPLKVAEGEGAPARAMVRHRSHASSFL